VRYGTASIAVESEVSPTKAKRRIKRLRNMIYLQTPFLAAENVIGRMKFPSRGCSFLNIS
jgi:hypothetical protein